MSVSEDLRASEAVPAPPEGPGGRHDNAQTFLAGRAACAAARPKARSFRLAPEELSFRLTGEDAEQGPHRSFRLTPTSFSEQRRPVRPPVNRMAAHFEAVEARAARDATPDDRPEPGQAQPARTPGGADRPPAWFLRTNLAVRGVAAAAIVASLVGLYFQENGLLQPLRAFIEAIFVG